MLGQRRLGSEQRVGVDLLFPKETPPNPEVSSDGGLRVRWILLVMQQYFELHGLEKLREVASLGNGISNYFASPANHVLRSKQAPNPAPKEPAMLSMGIGLASQTFLCHSAPG